MSKKPKADILVKDPLNVMPLFVNAVVGSGHLNSVVNVSFATANFTPKNDTSGTVDPDFIISCRLRMDFACAEQLYESLGRIVQQLKPANATTQ
jgi:hypothetical protein